MSEAGNSPGLLGAPLGSLARALGVFFSVPLGVPLGVPFGVASADGAISRSLPLRDGVVATDVADETPGDLGRTSSGRSEVDDEIVADEVDACWTRGEAG